MSLTKGMKFKGVVVMACDEEIIPTQNKIENIIDFEELEEGCNT